MLYVYLGALIVGAGTIFLQIILAGHGDADAHLDHDTSHGDAHDAEAWSVFLSARFWTFLFLALGIVGAAITYFQFAGPITTGIIAVAAGLAAGFFAALTLRALKKTSASSTTLTDAIGTVGRVLIPCAKGKVGKVRLQLKGQAVDVMAMTTELEIPVGESVVVNDVKGGMAHVSKAPKELSS